jgi:hypothetical protein
MSPAPLIARGIAEVAGVVAVFLAYPHLSLLLVVAAGLAAFPRTVTPTILMVGVAFIWLIQSGLHPNLLSVPRLAALALALYYLHAASALAAVLPNDGHATAGLYRPWLSRAALVTILTIAITLIVASLRTVTGTATAGTAGWIAELGGGLILAVGGGLFLFQLGRRG